MKSAETIAAQIAKAAMAKAIARGNLQPDDCAICGKRRGIGGRIVGGVGLCRECDFTLRAKRTAVTR